jgi:hypothetical protein
MYLRRDLVSEWIRKGKKERGLHYRGSGTGMPHNSNYTPRLIGATIEPVVLKITSFEPQVDYNNQYDRPGYPVI